LYRELGEKYGPDAQIPCFEKLKNLVNTKKKITNGHWSSCIVSQPWCNVPGSSDQKFLLFHNTVFIGSTYQHIVGWGHPGLRFDLKNGPVNVFLDCTFSVVPVPHVFKQLLVVMVYYKTYGLYVPIFHILLQNKHEALYDAAIGMIFIFCKLQGLSVTCDFEKGLINAARKHFQMYHDEDGNIEATPFIGCLFHVKQAWWRNLIAHDIPEALASNLCQKDGLLDMLTVLPPDDIAGKGIAFVRAHCNEGQYKDNFDKFWNEYFKPTWLNYYEVDTWNIYHVINGNPPQKIRSQLVNRTNNALERYNHTLQQELRKDHPSMPEFIQAIGAISCRMFDRMTRIRQGTERAAERDPVVYPSSPRAYLEWPYTEPPLTLVMKRRRIVT
jgi:hypothetical protein